MNKALILPIVALIVTLIKQTTGIQFDDDFSNILTDGLLAIFMMAGFFMQPKKGGGKK